MTYEDLIAEQDKQRTTRNFISFLGGAFGVDQSMANTDGYSINQPGQYATVTPYGVSVEGQPISNQQRGAIVLTPAMLLIGGLIAWAVLK